jgi:hypothetical protein
MCSAWRGQMYVGMDDAIHYLRHQGNKRRFSWPKGRQVSHARDGNEAGWSFCSLHPHDGPSQCCPDSMNKSMSELTHPRLFSVCL